MKNINLVTKSIKKWNVWVFMGILLIPGLMTACGKQEEIVFEQETEQMQTATDVLAFQELEKVEEQAEGVMIQEGKENQYQDQEQMGINQSNDLIYVDICGAVCKPGVYQVKKDSRLFEVVEMAGGLQEDAAIRYVNQARTLVDGEQIIILTKEEAQQAIETGELSSVTMAEQLQNTDAAHSGGNTQTQVQNSGQLNINTASLQELTTLSGIGESKAKLIILYRENNGGFSSTEEIMNIEGIGEKTYAKFAEQITVQ